MAKHVKVCDLTIVETVIVEPQKGNRAYPIVSIRKTSGVYQYEVIYKGKGTWHYKANESVLVP